MAMISSPARRRRAGAAGALMLALAAPAARADEAPSVEHQQIPCTVPEKAMALCATITDDGQVAKARIYFRRSGDKFFSFVDMVFGGLSYCGTLPPPRETMDALEYYIQAIDDQYQAKRTSTFTVRIQPEAVCGFPPVETNAARAASITVHATHKKQGKKLPGGFRAAGVTFVPLTK